MRIAASALTALVVIALLSTATAKAFAPSDAAIGVHRVLRLSVDRSYVLVRVVAMLEVVGASAISFGQPGVFCYLAIISMLGAFQLFRRALSQTPSTVCGCAGDSASEVGPRVCHSPQLSLWTVSSCDSSGKSQDYH